MKQPRTTRIQQRNAGPVSETRSAFTMFEILLAISIMAIIALMSWPNLVSMLKEQTVQGNAEKVRKILDRARVMAVTQGTTIQVRYEIRGKKFIVIPSEAPDDSHETKSAGDLGMTTTFKQKSTKRDPYRIYSIGEGCLFHVDNSILSGEQIISESISDEQLMLVDNPAEGRDVSWSAPILYYADGSSSGGTMTVMDEKRRYIKLHVRDLTAAVSTQQLRYLTDSARATTE